MEGTEVTDSVSAPTEEDNTMQCKAQPWLDTLGGKKKEKNPCKHMKGDCQETWAIQKEFAPHTAEGQAVLLLAAGHVNTEDSHVFRDPAL